MSAKKNIDRALRVLRSATKEDPATVTELGNALGRSGGALHQALTRLVREGYAVRLREGVYVRGPRA